MALSGIPIDPQQCIGDSLLVLNSSFIELDSRTLALSTSTLQALSGNSDLYTLLQTTSGSLYSTTQNVSSNLYTLVQNTSGSLYSTTQNVSSNLYTLVQNTSGSLYTMIDAVSSVALSAGVTEIVAGTNITISSGKGVVTINSTATGGPSLTGITALAKYTFTGNGSQSAFVMAGATATQALAYRVDLNGVLQEPGADYTVSGTTLQFSSPPGNGVKIVVIEGSTVSSSATLTAIDLTNVKFTNEYTSAVTLTADDTQMLKVIVGGVNKYLRLYDIN